MKSGLYVFDLIGFDLITVVSCGVWYAYGAYMCACENHFKTTTMKCFWFVYIYFKVKQHNNITIVDTKKKEELVRVSK